jgi:short-subunit dehydrogenase
MSKAVLITGASSGIGKELTYLCADEGFDLILVARRYQKLEIIKQELESKYATKIYVLPTDLTQPGAVKTLMRDIEELGLQIDILINNAGFGGYGLFHECDWDKYRDMINLNVLALTELTRSVLPGMVERKDGRVLNIASMAGFVPGPLHAVYYATKSYVLSFSEAIYNELEGSGVTVTTLCPGPTRTEFIENAGVEDVAAFKNSASPIKVAKSGYDGMMKGRRLVIPGLDNKLLAQVPRFIPRWLALKISRAMEAKN